MLRSIIAQPVRCVGGELRVPGDKSISHRALMLGSAADGVSEIRGFLASEDCLATKTAMRALGVRIDDTEDGRLVVHGAGLTGFTSPAGTLDLGNSGTAIRLLAGLLAGQPFTAELTGDASLRARPMERVAEPLRAMGARIVTNNGRAPLRIEGGARLHGIDYRMPVASAQVKSAVLLAGLQAQGRTTVRSPGPSRDHTERMLTAMGVEVERGQAGYTVSLEGPASLRPVSVDVPGDFSSAAFFLVAGCVGAEDALVLRGVGVNPTRIGLMTMLNAMGARIDLRNTRRQGGEQVADLHVSRSPLRGIDVPADLVPLAIDEFPVLFVAAAAASGETRIRGASELRHKESDRIGVMAKALSALGAEVTELPDGMIIRGGARLRGGTVDSCGDHRVAMSVAVASLLADGPIEITNTEHVATSFPRFIDAGRSIGLRLEGNDGSRP